MDPKKEDEKDGKAAADAGAKPGADAPAKSADAGGESGKGSEKDAAYWEAEAKKAFKQRDELKQKVDEEANARLAEQGKYKEMLEKIEPEYKTLKAFKAEYDQTVQTRLAESEKLLSAEDKGEYDQFISALSHEKRLDWISKRLKASADAQTPASSPGSSRPAAPGAKKLSQAQLEAMSPRERAQFFQDGGVAT